MTSPSIVSVTPVRLATVFSIMLLVCIVAYSGIALMHESLKWDALDCYFPWRYAVGESLQHGIFPLWNPYQHFGYPIFGDLRSVFYPEGLLIGLFSGYSIATLNMLFIAYLSIAGTGFYLLTGHFTPSHPARLLAGLAYMLSGFFVGHGQELFGIVAATWIPWIIYYFLKLQHGAQWSDLWKLAFFLFLQLTGGYQALSMMLLYLLVILFVSEHLFKVIHHRWAELRKLLAMHALLSLIVALSLTVLAITFWQIAPHLQRFAGITLADAHFMPFSPQSTISWLMPFAVVTDTDFYDTDLSMNNGHIGLLLLMALGLALFRKRNVRTNVVLGFGVVCLLAAFGSYTPVREFLFQWAPLMDMFRMSAFFNYFAMLAFILVGSSELGEIISSPERNYKRVLAASAVMLACILGIGIYFYVANDVSKFQPIIFLQNYRDSLGTSPRAYHVLIHGVIQAGILLFFMCGVWFLRTKKRAFIALLFAFLLVEMTLAVKLNFPITVGSGYAPARLQTGLDATPFGFPVPDLTKPLGNFPDNNQALNPLWHNTNIFTKTASFDGFNSFRLDAFENFREDSSEQFAAALTRPVVYFSDSSAFENTDTIVMQRFEPGHVAFTLNANSERSVVLQQTDFMGWQAYIDGIPTQHSVTGIFSTLSVPKGNHRIEYHFSNPLVMLGFGISYGMFALICGAVIFFLLRDELHISKRVSAFGTIGIVLAMGGTILVSWHAKESDMQQRHKGYSALSNALNAEKDAIPLLLTLDLPHIFDSISAANGMQLHPIYLRNSTPFQLNALRKTLDSAFHKGANHVAVGGDGIRTDAVAREMVLLYFPREEKVLEGRTYLSLFHRDGTHDALFSISNNLEQSTTDWPFDTTLADTTHHKSGTHSWRIDATQPGSPGISFSLAEKQAAGMQKAVVEMQVFTSSIDASAAVYFIVERNGKSIWERTADVRHQYLGVEIWSECMWVITPPFPLIPDDRIKVFVWGGSQQALYLDDLKLSLYAQP